MRPRNLVRVFSINQSINQSINEQTYISFLLAVIAGCFVPRFLLLMFGSSVKVLHPGMELECNLLALFEFLCKLLIQYFLIFSFFPLFLVLRSVVNNLFVKWMFQFKWMFQLFKVLIVIRLELKKKFDSFFKPSIKSQYIKLLREFKKVVSQFPM